MQVANKCLGELYIVGSSKGGKEIVHSNLERLLGNCQFVSTILDVGAWVDDYHDGPLMASSRPIPFAQQQNSNLPNHLDHQVSIPHQNNL